jgi:hypothetical protein
VSTGQPKRLERRATGGESPVGDGLVPSLVHVRKYRGRREGLREAGTTTFQG